MKSSILYVGMLAALVAGLFGILRAGAGLRAPADLRGEWRIVGGTAPGELLSIRQSGRFVRLSVDGGEELALRWRDDAPEAQGALAQLSGDGVEITLRALAAEEPPAATHVLEARGALEATWRIRRSTRSAPAKPGAAR